MIKKQGGLNMNRRVSLMGLLLALPIAAGFVVRGEGDPSKEPHKNAVVTPTQVDLVEQTKIEKSEVDWKTQLSAAQFAIARNKGTERPFSSLLLNEKDHGVFRCVACETPLFASDGKFESGTGWPSFFKPFIARNVLTAKDATLGMTRDEVLCARCGSHLGHVFDDGPKPTGLRYCINGVVLKLEKR